MTIKVGDFVIIDDMKYHRGPIQVITIYFMILYNIIFSMSDSLSFH